jgi:hypothetical protein
MVAFGTNTLAAVQHLCQKRELISGVTSWEPTFSETGVCKSS